MNKTFKCYYCGEQDISKLKKDTYVKSTNSGKCLICHYKYCNKYQRKKRAEKKPAQWVKCSCGDYVKIRRSSLYGFDKPVKDIKCKGCGKEFSC